MENRIQIPTGKPPPGFAKRLQYMQHGEIDVTPPETVTATAVDAPPVPSEVPAAKFVDRPEVQTTTVILAFGLQGEFPGLSVTFEAQDLEVHDDRITMAIDPKLSLQPGDVVRAELRLNGRPHPVIWATGSFRLRSVGLNVLTFLRRPEEQGGS